MRAPSVPSLPSSLLMRAIALIATAKNAWMRRRLVGQMTGFDDHMLRDIGLTRADLHAALSSSGLNDPTLRLAVRANEARSNRRAVALERHYWSTMVAAAEGSEAAGSVRRAA